MAAGSAGLLVASVSRKLGSSPAFPSFSPLVQGSPNCCAQVESYGIQKMGRFVSGFLGKARSSGRAAYQYLCWVLGYNCVFLVEYFALDLIMVEVCRGIRAGY